MRSTPRSIFALTLTPAAALAITSFSFGSAPVNTEFLDTMHDRPGLAVGEAAPEIKLTTTSGEEIDLSSLYADGPLVVTFYRCGWCPHCNKALMDWAGRYADVTEAGGQFIAITPEKAENAQATLEKADAGYTVFIDPEGDVGKAFRVQFQVDPKTIKAYKGYGIDLEQANVNGRWELPAPATFVIDTDGVIRYAHASWDYRADQRANPDEVIAAVREIK